MRDDSDRPIGPGETPGGARVSVVMPVHNALPYLDESIASILGQTHGDFEFVIGDDGSTDGSSDALRGWAARDSRIRLLRRAQASGPVRSSNWVAGEAREALVARMDADDVAHPERLARQLAVLRRRPDAVLAASLSVGIDPKGRTVRAPDRWMLAGSGFAAPFAHGSILYRRAAFERVGGYREACEYWEDLDLYLRLGEIGPLLVLPEGLYRYRFADTSTRLTSAAVRVERAIALLLDCQDAHRRGEDYEALLANDARPGRIRADAFRSIAVGPVWAGRSPRMIARMAKRAAIGLDRRALTSWLFVLWGSLAPRMLRLALRQRLRIKNRLARARFPDGGAYEWRCRVEAAKAAAPGFAPADPAPVAIGGGSP